jgi:hypothetical protein
MSNLEKSKNIYNFIKKIGPDRIDNISLEYRNDQVEYTSKRINLRATSSDTPTDWLKISVDGSQYSAEINSLLQWLKEAPIVCRKLELVLANYVISKKELKNIPYSTLFGNKVWINNTPSGSTHTSKLVFTPGKVSHYSKTTIPVLNLGGKRNDHTKEILRIITDIFDGELLPF